MLNPTTAGGLTTHPHLEEIGRLQAIALQRQGANPNQGRALAGLFHAARLKEVETGVIGGQWKAAPGEDEWGLEWQTLASDLEDILPPDRLGALQQLDRQAWQFGQRVLFVPTFYAVGRKRN